MKNAGTHKKRSASCYEKKVRRITKWYNTLVKVRGVATTNTNTKQEPKRKELKPLEFYIDKLKKPTKD
jgi:hypothetical protein